MDKYKMIANDLAQKIQSGELPTGTKLPSETELCDRYNVSRITVKKATDRLLMLGMITKRRGAGTFVKDISDMTKEAAAPTDITFTGFTKQFQGRKTKTTVNLFEIVPAEGEIAEALNLTADDFVYHIIRTRLVDDIPYVVEYTYMPINVIPGITRTILNGSIYSFIFETLGLKPQSAHRTIRALLPTKEEHEFFNEKKAFAILETKQVAYLNDGRAFEYSISHHHGAHYSFTHVSVTA